MSDARIVQRGLEQLGIDLERLRELASPLPPLPQPVEEEPVEERPIVKKARIAISKIVKKK